MSETLEEEIHLEEVLNTVARINPVPGREACQVGRHLLTLEDSAHFQMMKFLH